MTVCRLRLQTGQCYPDIYFRSDPFLLLICKTEWDWSGLCNFYNHCWLLTVLTQQCHPMSHVIRYLVTCHGVSVSVVWRHVCCDLAEQLPPVTPACWAWSHQKKVASLPAGGAAPPTGYWIWQLLLTYTYTDNLYILHKICALYCARRLYREAPIFFLLAFQRIA